MSMRGARHSGGADVNVGGGTTPKKAAMLRIRRQSESRKGWSGGNGSSASGCARAVGGGSTLQKNELHGLRCSTSGNCSSEIGRARVTGGGLGGGAETGSQGRR